MIVMVVRLITVTVFSYVFICILIFSSALVATLFLSEQYYTNVSFVFKL